MPRAAHRRGARAAIPLGAIAALGGEAVLAHPLHPRRPFTGWGTGPWRGFEIVSNDTAWRGGGAGRDWGKAARSPRWSCPCDRARAVLALADDATTSGALRRGARAPRAGRPAPARAVLLCSADAHGYPSYRAAFEAFSMHLPVTLAGDAAADVARRLRGAPRRAGRLRVRRGRARRARSGSSWRAGGRRAFELHVEAPDLSARPVHAPARRRVGGARGPPPRTPARRSSASTAAPGRARRATTGSRAGWDGRPWIFTNPVGIE